MPCGDLTTSKSTAIQNAEHTHTHTSVALIDSIRLNRNTWPFPRKWTKHFQKGKEKSKMAFRGAASSLGPESVLNFVQQRSRLRHVS